MDKEEEPYETESFTSVNCDKMAKSSPENKRLFKGRRFSDTEINSEIVEGTFHKFRLEDNLDSNHASVNLEMEKFKDKNENEVDPMLDSVKNECAKIKVLVKKTPEIKRNSCCSCCGSSVKMLIGTICATIGLLLFLYTPFDFLMRERLKMMPGLPAYDWWLKPPDNVYFKIYIFNITNPYQFLKGKDINLNFEEVGPVVFKEILEHFNTTFNNNNTLTYTARRTLKFLDDHNNYLDLNSTIYVPNIVSLGFASYLHDASMLTKMGFRFFSGKNSPAIVKTTVHDYLWNLTDPLLTAVKNFAPGLVPTDNVGVLKMMYEDFTDEVTVFIGPESGDEKFFTIDKFHGMPTLPGYDTYNCNDSLENATEGVLYSQRLTHKSKLHYWRKTLCKVVTLDFNKEIDYNGILAYEFVLPYNAYHRSSRPEYPDCYAGNPLLVNGLSDISKCYFDLPMATSLPHFYATDSRGLKKITGMKPNPKKHASFAIVEPLTGTPLSSCARSQSNLVVRKLTQLSSEMMLFSDMTLPMFWAEYSAPELPDYIWNLVVITVKVIPILQIVISSSIVLGGLILLYFGCRNMECFRSKSFHSHQQLDNYARKTIFGQDKKIFR